MARFPTTEAKIAQLAQQIADGLEHAAEQFPSPTVPPAVLRAQLEDFREKSSALAQARSNASVLCVNKNKALKTLKDSMRANLRYAEIWARRNPEQLLRIGWQPRRTRTPLKPPGEVRNIEVLKEGLTWMVLGWDAPEKSRQLDALLEFSDSLRIN